MSGQLFREAVPRSLIISVTEALCAKNGGSYTLSLATYRAAAHRGDVERIRNALKPYYHLSKQYYVTRGATYGHTATLLRQLCKSIGASFTSKILYSRSTYELRYRIIVPPEDDS